MATKRKKRYSLGYSRIVLDLSGVGRDEIHAGLLVKGAAGRAVVRVVDRVLVVKVAAVVVVVDDDFGRDELGLLLPLPGGGGVVFGAGTGELDELDAGGADGVGPVEGAFGLGDAAGDLVEEVGGGDGAVERSDEVRGERVEGLKKKGQTRADS